MTLAFMLLTMTAQTAWALDPLNVFNYTFAIGSDNEGEYYVVDGTEALDALATYVNVGNNASGMRFKQTADITYTHTTDWNDANSDENNFTAIGNGNYFSGIFDGAGHTISGIRIYKSGQYETGNSRQALFSRIEGATVKNVILADARITGFLDCGGIVGYVLNSGRIENCHALSTVTIHAVQSDASSHGGIVGFLECRKDVTVVEGCTSAASITTTVSSSENYGGIAGVVGQDCTVSDCIYLGSTVEGSCNVGAIAGYIKGTVSNCYYTNTTLASAIGKIESGSTVEDVRLATSDDFAVSGDTYTIGSAAGWSVFCGALYHNDTYNRFSGKTVYLANDITVTRMAGSEYHDFCGTFDGGGHTLTFNYGTSDSYASEEYTAPFRYVSNTKPVGSNTDSPVTIRNLHVAGDIYTTAKCAAGLICRKWGSVTIRNCRSSIVIHSSVTNDDGNDGTHSGFVAVIQDGSLSFEGCLFDGKLLTTATTSTTNCGGFVGWNGATFTNCLYAPAALADGETEVQTGTGNNPSCTFARNWSGTPTNSYYTRALGTAQGKQAHSITAGQGITVALSGTATEYATSGITAYKDGNTQKPGLLYNGTIYAGNGDNVSLTLGNTPPESYSFIDYTVNPEETTFTSSENAYSLTMSNADVEIGATFEFLPNAIPYLDMNGHQRYCVEYTILDGSTTTLGTASQETWYVADGTIDFDQHISTAGDVHIILKDGAVMNVGTENSPIQDYGIGDDIASSSISIYGQSTGTNNGQLNVYATREGILTGGDFNCSSAKVTASSSDEYGIYAYHANTDMGNITLKDATVNATGAYGLYANANLTINGGKVTATGTASNGPRVGIYVEYGSVNINGGEVTATATATSSNVFCVGIQAGSGSVNISGGKVTATGNGDGYGILASVNISGGQVTATGTIYGICVVYGGKTNLGWTNPTDYILANSYSVGSITLTKTFIDEEGNLHTDYNVGDIAGKTLRPYSSNTDVSSSLLVLADDADNTAIINTFNGERYNVTLAGRTLSKSGDWNTLCLPFGVTAAQMDVATHPLHGATIKELDNSASGTNLDDEGALTLKFNTVYDGSTYTGNLVAGKPYIVKWENTTGSLSDPVFSGVTITSTTPTEVISNDANVKFVGQYSPFSITEANKDEILFVGSGNQIGYVSSTATLPRTLKNFRAHFWVKPNGTSFGARAINVDWGDRETTSISEKGIVNSEKSATATEWYTIDGRRLTGKPTQRGVYINSGRKIIIK